MSLRISALASIVVALALVAAVADRARACSCMQQDQPTAFEEAASVFEGRVVSISAPVGEVGGAEPITVTLDVVRTWKGANVERIEVRTAGNSAACGYHFQQGQSYLVYTYAVDGAEHVSLCSRTRRIEQAAEDLAAMGEGVTPASPHEPTETAEPTQPATRPGEVQAYEAGCASCAVGSDRCAAPVLPGAAFLLLFALLRLNRPS